MAADLCAFLYFIAALPVKYVQAPVTDNISVVKFEWSMREDKNQRLIRVARTVLEAKVMRCEETNKNLCYGFIKFAASSAAIKAMQEMNGKLLCGRPLR